MTAFKSTCKRAKLTDVTRHVMRHTLACRFVMKGADLRTVQELGGWKSLAMAQRYAYLSPKYTRHVIELFAQNSPCDNPYAPRGGNP
jgi:site-specific recombinase XerD